MTGNGKDKKLSDETYQSDSRLFISYAISDQQGVDYFRLPVDAVTGDSVHTGPVILSQLIDISKHRYLKTEAKGMNKNGIETHRDDSNRTPEDLFMNIKSCYSQ